MYGYTLNVAKETDLIYEGIATWAPAVGGPTPGAKETDLIYEGIATVNKWVRILHLPTSERNWPDLRRDCDAWVMDRDITLCCRGKKLTWFTKGLRRKVRDGTFFCPYQVKKLTWFTKGLRRLLLTSITTSILKSKKLTWFTKGLRLPKSLAIFFCFIL